jgi:hypothetical protein
MAFQFLVEVGPIEAGLLGGPGHVSLVQFEVEEKILFFKLAEPLFLGFFERA